MKHLAPDERTYGWNENWSDVECAFCGHLFRIEYGWIVDDLGAWAVGEPCPECGDALSYYCLVPPLTDEEKEQYGLS